MNETIEIQIQSWTNGYTLSIFDHADGYVVREIADTKSEVLQTLLLELANMAMTERKKIMEAV